MEMADDSYPNFETLCRLCLQPESATVNIFPSDAVANNQLSVPLRIMACVALEVVPSDGLPKAICIDCRYQLEKSYYFRKRCQLSDSKLKKHMRLQNLGKRSRIFSRTEEENFEDELEFEDSLIFLKEHDALREKEEQRKNKLWKDSIKDEMKHEIIEMYKDEIRDGLKNKIRQELREEVVKDVKEEVRTEVVQEVRESLKLSVLKESIEQAKIELRDELEAEWREDERENFLEELHEFVELKSRKMARNRTTDERLCVADVPESGKVDMISVKVEPTKKFDALTVKKSEKRSTNSLLMSPVKKFNLDTAVVAGSSDNEITSTEQATAITSVASESQDDGADGTESDFYILEDEVDGDDVESSHMDDQDGQGGDAFFSYGDSLNFQINASENSVNDNAIYQIEDNGDVKFFKKEVDVETDENDVEDADANMEDNVLIFDPDLEQDEFIEEEQNIVLKKNSLLIENMTKKSSVESSIKKTISGSNVNSHLLTIPSTSSVTKTFLCPKCPRVFTTETSMLRHLTVHTSQQKKGVSYQCPNCQIILSCKSALNRHMMKHSGRRPFVCEECGKSFIQREILKRHLLTHSGVRPYDCPNCDRSFTQKMNLNQHINKYHTENPIVQHYPCHMCPKRFNHASGLSRHLATHSGVAFQCTECERTFNDRSSVKRHIVHVHGASVIEKMLPVSSLDSEMLETDTKKDEENSTDYIPLA